MTAPKPKPLGTSVEVPEGASVTRPNGDEIRVSGGVYVLDVPGEHVVDGKPIAASGDVEQENAGS